MPFASIASFTAAGLSVITATVTILRNWRSPVHRLFAAGMLLFAAEELLRCAIQGSIFRGNIAYLQEWVFEISTLNSVIWIAFSIWYARIDPNDSTLKWKSLLFALGALAILIVPV